ncbi:uncharacterized protein [Aristolochia californica]|uniref:uncharacterized protein n=1 Tax=Aristolochia californica TaxID=171875 RepID=UPI0035DD75EF
MGKLSCDLLIHHFSHPHPLELFNAQQMSSVAFVAPCAGCKEKLSGWVYICKLCNFSLHVACSQMPQLIHHPAHAIHPLSLLPLPAYSAGYFNCDACGRRGDGFSYHCGACDLDIHALCAALPLSVAHQAHHHPLNLEFIPPYHNKGFSCDLCGNLGSNHWLYRCSSCEFDAHLGCVTAGKQRNVDTVVQAAPVQYQRPQSQQVQMQRPPLPGTAALGAGFFGGATPIQMGPQYQVTYPAGPQEQRGTAINNSYVNSSPGPGGPQMYSEPPATARDAGAGNNLMQVMMQGLLDGASQQIGQSLVQSLVGGGGGGGGGDNGGGGGSVDGNSSSVSVMDIGSTVFGGCDESGSSASDY